jgi:hypothetical protein
MTHITSSGSNYSTHNICHINRISILVLHCISIQHPEKKMKRGTVVERISETIEHSSYIHVCIPHAYLRTAMGILIVQKISLFYTAN